MSRVAGQIDGATRRAPKVMARRSDFSRDVSIAVKTARTRSRLTMDGQAGMNSGGLLCARHGLRYLHGGDLASTWVTKHEVHAERVVTLVKQSL